MLFATIFLVCFVLLAGLVMFLSKTIDHGEARFDSSGKEMKNTPSDEGETNTDGARPATRIESDKDQTGDQT